MGRVPIQEEAHMVAEWMLQFAGDSLGPGGGWKLVDEDEPILLDSAASALREIRLPDGAAGFYKQLATGVHAAVGDGGSLAVFLAAHLVAYRVRGQLDGLPIALRQAKAWLSAHAKPAKWPALPDVTALADEGTIALDDVDIRVDRPGWHMGLHLTPQWGPQNAGTGNVLLLQTWRRRLQNSAVARGHFLDAEEARLRNEIQKVTELGVGLVVCLGAVGDDVATALQNAGIHVTHDASKPLVRRLERATGATLVPTIQEASSEALGRADWTWDDGLVVEGPGMSATFGVEAENEWAGAMATDKAERQLRLAGALLEDSRALPQDWPVQLATNLRTIAPLAEGRAPFGIESLAEALEAYGRAVTRNQGFDAWENHKLGGQDALIVVRLALEAAVQTAVQILRLDGRFDKRPSGGQALRGGSNRIGSPKGMPGDVPPLM
ncbi:MAG: TCP-1/cpn60 chaperonin family protein [Thermoplasmatota archaeon]